MKKAVQVVIEKYYMCLGSDFRTNKYECEAIAIISSKKLCSEIAGSVTHLMKQIQRGPMRGSPSSYRKGREKGEMIMFLKSRLWIRRSLKLTLTLRKY